MTHPRAAGPVPNNLAFDRDAQISTVTAERGRQSRVLPDVEGAYLEEGSGTPKGSTLTLTLPPQAFTVVEAATTGG